MSEPLWTWANIAVAASGATDGVAPEAIFGISIDTRAIGPGDLFVALTDQRDGHAFVPTAFKAGAAAALVRTSYVRQPGDGALLRVDDPLRALERIAAAARARLAPDSRVIAVTGSAGKTGTKEMLRLVLAPLGQVHAPEKSFNNHWGVPLTLARMPAATRYAVIEIGMNHAGEITPLTKLARPHVAVVTNVLPVHVGNFPEGEIGVAKAKAEIFLGLEPGGSAIIPADSPHRATLEAAAERMASEVVTFGERPDATCRAASIATEPSHSVVRVDFPTASTPKPEMAYRLGAPGRHLALNSVAVLAALLATAEGDDWTSAMAPLRGFMVPPGRGAQRVVQIAAGRIRLIDESYNANPASMRAALAVLAATQPAGAGRRIAVLGDMRELGDLGPRLHHELAASVADSKVDLLFACGPLMRNLVDAVAPATRPHWSEKSTALVQPLLDVLADGDVVMVKGSLGTNMAPIVSALFRQDTAGHSTT
jgi:UDP-N-acetylmuramoyl-tripeptide--D-alanyl-D-alanine ligase